MKARHIYFSGNIHIEETKRNENTTPTQHSDSKNYDPTLMGPNLGATRYFLGDHGAVWKL